MDAIDTRLFEGRYSEHCGALIENSSMFRKSLEGRFVLDIIRTVLQTAVAAGVPVHEYLVSVLREDPEEIASNPERFTPLGWAMRAASDK